MELWVVIGAVVLVFGWVAFRGAPYVPTHRTQLTRAFTELYPLSPSDVLVDMGSGDGVVLRAASRYGARAIGYELNPILVILSKLISRGDKKVEVRLADLWLSSLPSDTTVVYMFTVSRDLRKLAKKLQYEANRLSHPIALVIYGHKLADMQPDNEVGAHSLYHFYPLQ